MALDPRTPVIVGAGQVNQRDGNLEPTDLLAEAARLALTDAGGDAGRLGSAVDSIRVVSLLSWRYRDPGALVAAGLGISPRETAYTQPGGNTPQSLINRTSAEIARGELGAAIIGGAECWRTRMSFRSAGEKPEWTVQDESVPEATVIGDDFVMMHPAELSRGIAMPVQVYPMLEQAVRARAGRSIDDHLVFISELWARFSEVGATNPNAWSRTAYTAEQIRTPGPDNRWIGFPYPKLMNSNNNVEQSAALVLCSAEVAEAAGVPRDRWVFPRSGADAHDTYALSHRSDLHSSPGIRSCGTQVLSHEGVTADDIAHVDLYSCFPSAVEIAASELGFPLDDRSRALTVTGGLTFAGGPWNNYVTHAVATMVDVLRNDPGSLGLCSANGGFITKHAVGLYSTEPSGAGFAALDAQPDADAATAPREVAEDYEGAARVEAWTVMHDRAGEPETGFAAVLLDDGRRAWGRTGDGDTMKVMLAEDITNRPARLDTDGTLRL